MKKKITALALIIAVILIGYAGITLVYPHSMNCCHGEQYLPPINPELKDWNVYTENSFGFVFAYPKDLTVSKKENVLTIGTGKEAGYAPFDIVEISDSKVDDPTGKWGTYSIRFDAASNAWIVTRASERDGSSYDTKTEPLMTTYGGYPVFEGGIRSHGFGRYTYIVALSHEKFLLVSGQETFEPSMPEKEPLYTLVKSIIRN